MEKKPKYPFWLQEIIDAGKAGFISPEDVQKCIDGLDEAKDVLNYNDKRPLLYNFLWKDHSYGDDFWVDIDTQLDLYREKTYYQ